MVVIVIGPREAPEQSSHVAYDAQGCERMIHFIRDDHRQPDGCTDEPSAWAACLAVVDRGELDLDVLRFVPGVVTP